jgi:hypothetical protein
MMAGLEIDMTEMIDNAIRAMRGQMLEGLVISRLEDETTNLLGQLDADTQNRLRAVAAERVEDAISQAAVYLAREVRQSAVRGVGAMGRGERVSGPLLTCGKCGNWSRSPHTSLGRCELTGGRTHETSCGCLRWWEGDA